MHVVIPMYAADADGAVYSIARRHVEYLVKCGDRVTLISDRCPKDLQDVNCIHVEPLNSRFSRYLDFKLVRFISKIPFNKCRTLLAVKGFLPQLFFSFKAGRLVQQILLHENIDCLLCEQVFVTPGLRRVQAKYRIPIVFVEHGPDVFASPWEFLGIPFTIYYRYATKVTCRVVDHIIAVSKGMACCAISHGLNQSKVSVVHNSIDINEIGGNRSNQISLKRKAKHELLFVGSLESRKGVITLLEALTLLRKKPVYCRFVGDGPLANTLSKEADRLGISHHCEFVGSQPRANLGAYYKRADCFILPSISEGLPVVILEALASGLPVVASHVGGIPDAVQHGKTGFLVPPCDAMALANAIVRVCEDVDLRKSMSKKAKKKAEFFAWPCLLKSFREILSKVVHQRFQSNL